MENNKSGHPMYSCGLCVYTYTGVHTQASPFAVSTPIINCVFYSLLCLGSDIVFNTDICYSSYEENLDV